MRITAGTNAWRKVEGVMGDRHLIIKEMCSVRVATAYTNALETMALTDKQQEKSTID